MCPILACPVPGRATCDVLHEQGAWMFSLAKAGCGVNLLPPGRLTVLHRASTSTGLRGTYCVPLALVSERMIQEGLVPRVSE